MQLSSFSYNSVLLRLNSPLKLPSSESLLCGDVGIHGNCARSSGVRSGEAGMFAISMPSSVDVTSIEERGVRLRLRGRKRLLRFEEGVETSRKDEASGDDIGARGSVGGKALWSCWG